jgi:uncharacterized membrane protein YqjE
MDYRGRTSAALDIEEPKNAESNGRSFAGILKDIGGSIQELIRGEVKLARMEMADSARRLGSSSKMLIGGGLLAIYAIGFILLAALFALEIVVPAWAAALMLGVLLCVGAGVAISIGRQRLKQVHAPHKTMQSMKDDFQWIKEQARL